MEIKMKKKLDKSVYRWALIITVITFFLSLFFSFLSTTAISKLNLLPSIIILFLVIFLGILFDLVGDTPEFCIVDINRMEFGSVSLQKGCANFARLWGSPEMFRIMATEYAKTRGWDTETVCSEVLKYRRQYWQKAIRKRPAQFPLEF
jgi:hypothetical protein